MERFRELAEEAGILEDMEVEIIPGMPHSLYQKGHGEMLNAIEKKFQAREDK